MEVAKEMQEKEKKRPRLVIFPAPSQGHINPMLQLATLLHSKGFSITIIHTHYNSPNPSNFPNFHFEPIPDRLSDVQASITEEPITLVSILNDTCQVPFRDRLSRMLSDSSQGPIHCIITDALLHFTQAIADELKLPRIVLSTISATFSVVTASMMLLQQSGFMNSMIDCQPDTLIPEIPPLRIKDLPDFSQTDPDILARSAAKVYKATMGASAVIINAYDGLESTMLEKMKKDCHPVPIFPVGPLHKFSPVSSDILLTQDHSCMAWLDKQTPRSVIYISFGSTASIDKTELVEISWGLANSNQSFLWVIRPGSIHGHDWFEMPADVLKEKIWERGLIVKWAPQQEVLAHPSVGGFWTHSGWNSTLESVCEGVPMLCSPYLWDQTLNARYVSHVWKVGLQLENGFERGEIEWAIRKLMEDIEGKEMRQRLSGFKENAMRCIRKDGSSYQSVENLIEFIISCHENVPNGLRRFHFRSRH